MREACRNWLIQTLRRKLWRWNYDSSLFVKVDLFVAALEVLHLAAAVGDSLNQAIAHSVRAHAVLELRVGQEAGA